MDLAQSSGGGSHFDALKANAERERAANRKSHLGYHAFIDDEGTPTIFHGYGPDALSQWNKNRGTYKGPFDTHEAAVEWLAALCDRLAERYRKAAERYRFTMRQIAEDRAADKAAGGSVSHSPNVAEAACEVGAEVDSELCDGECDE